MRKLRLREADKPERNVSKFEHQQGSPAQSPFLTLHTFKFYSKIGAFFHFLELTMLT